MSISAEDLKAILFQQQAQFEAAQLNLIEALKSQLMLPPGSSTAAVKPCASVDAIVSSISTFSYDPDAGLTFENWFQRYEDVFRVELSGNGDAQNVRLLLRKLGATEHAKYVK